MTSVELVPSRSASASLELQPSEWRYLTALAFGLGASQGCGLCFYVASGPYFGDLFDDQDFFANACAFFFLPPILVTLVQVVLDQRFDARLGIRPVIRFRIFLSSLMVALLLVSMSGTVESPAYPGEGRLVYGCGVMLGIFAAIFLASTCLLFGAVDPRFVPYVILGQTFAGVYTNASARLLGFGPGCSLWRARAFFGLAACSVLAGVLAYAAYNCSRLLERAYQHHEILLRAARSCDDVVSSEGSRSSLAGLPACGGFPATCWSMVLCQALAIAMNMSLTPLASQVARGSFELAQELVLVKLLADFVGRVLYLLLPRPQGVPGRGLLSVRGQAALVWLLGMARAPLWLLVYRRAMGFAVPALLSSRLALLWLVWLPLIATGALSSSWCFVVAVTATPEESRRSVNLLMSFSVYAGYAGGLLVALLSR